MATPLAATARIILRYTVQGFPHRLAMYMAYNVVLGVNQMVDRDGITTVLWSLGAQYVWDKMRAVYTAAAVPVAGTATLESRAGALWNPVTIYNLTGVGSAGGSIKLAQQETWTLRDTAFKKVRWMIFETVGDYVFHSPVGSFGSAPFDAITDMLSGNDANASAPYRWLKSRGDRFLLATGVVAGVTADLNDKLKRERFLE